MNIQTLKDLLIQENVQEDAFSLTGELLPDAIILNHYSNTWEVFYYSERGDKEVYGVYSSEGDACQKIWELFTGSKAVGSAPQPQNDQP